jgi:hypothetical protein
MIIFSYNLSPLLTSQLKNIDKLRSRILLTPVSPILLHELVWKSTFAHLSGWASLSNQPISSDTLQNILLGPGDNRTSTSFIKKAQDYRSALNHLWLDWTANPKAITAADLKRLADTLGVSFKHEEEVNSLLGYIQTGSVHPIIQSAITHLYFYPSRLSYLSSLLVLYKHGFSLNRLLSLEDYWSQNKQAYLSVIQSATKLGQITLWLEYYCQALITQMEVIAKTLSTPNPISKSSTHWQLSLRQKSILSLLDPPGSTITNRQVQSHFKVSQITASRDLAKLTSLNLLIPRGHGRSTTYTRS